MFINMQVEDGVEFSRGRLRGRAGGHRRDSVAVDRATMRRESAAKREDVQAAKQGGKKSKKVKKEKGAKAERGGHIGTALLGEAAMVQVTVERAGGGDGDAKTTASGGGGGWGHMPTSES